MRRIAVAGLATLATFALALNATASSSDERAAVERALNALPTVERTLSTSRAVNRPCAGSAVRKRAGVAITRWTAPMSGFANVRMSGVRKSNWDLVVADTATGQTLGTSEAFHSTEVAQTWVAAGQRLTIMGCLRKGAGAARVTIKEVDVAPPKISGTPSLVRVDVAGREEFERLEGLGVDITHEAHDGHADVIVANADQANLLRKAGFSFRTRVADLQRYYEESRRADLRYAQRLGTRSNSLPTGRTGYRNYSDYQQEMTDLATANPNIVKPVTMPHKSFQGREINGLEIAENVKKNDGRPVFLLVAMHHAREWPSAESAIEFAHLLVQGYGTDSRITEILRNTRTVIVPLINPDGFISAHDRTGPADPADRLSENGFDPNLEDLRADEQDPTDCPLDPENCNNGLDLAEGIAPPGGILAYRRKNCDGLVPDGNMPCELQWGVDPNRNYGEAWGGAGSSSDPTDQGYRGTGPWSEPETQNVHEFSQSHAVTTLITLHNVAALVLRPPGLHDKGKAPDEERLRRLGDAMGEATGYTSQYGFQLYDTAGTTEDWNYAAAGTFGFTIEIGPKGGKFHMPYETGVVHEWDGTTAGNGRGLREALLLAAENSYDTTDHSVIEGTAVPGATLRLKKSFQTFTSAFCENEVSPPVKFLNPPLSQVTEDRCVGEQPARGIDDGLNYSTVVPDSGRFEWHVTPSTRPFAGQTSTLGEIDKDRSTRTDTFTNTEPMKKAFEEDPTWDGKAQAGGFQAPEGSYIDKEFTLSTEDEAAELEIDVPTEDGQDLDIELYFRSTGGALALIDTSYSGAGVDEEIIVAPEDLLFGTYVLRVINYNSDNSNWTATVQRHPRKPDTVIPGSKESWTMTCEDAKGNVLESRQVVVDRGQRVSLDLLCGRQAPQIGQGGGSGGGDSDGGSTEPPAAGQPDTPAPQPRGAAPQPEGAVPPKSAPTRPATGDKKRAAEKRKRVLKKKRAACLKKARRKRGARKRAAIKRCERQHRARTRRRT